MLFIIPDVRLFSLDAVKICNKIIINPKSKKEVGEHWKERIVKDYSSSIIYNPKYIGYDIYFFIQISTKRMNNTKCGTCATWAHLFGLPKFIPDCYLYCSMLSIADRFELKRYWFNRTFRLVLTVFYSNKLNGFGNRDSLCKHSPITRYNQLHSNKITHTQT